MPRFSHLREIVTVVAGLIAVVVISGLVWSDRPGGALQDASALSWAVPVISGALVGFVAWLLLSRSEQRSRSLTPSESARCANCGSDVFEEWRLCPYCGKFVDEPAEKTESASAHV